MLLIAILPENSLRPLSIKIFGLPRSEATRARILLRLRLLYTHFTQ
jgi:hypothetical protein